jgi:hypothetical protein
LYDLAVDAPGNGLVSTDPGAFGAGKGIQLKTFVDGTENKFYVDPKYAKSWIGNDPLLNETFAKVLQHGLGGSLLKATATGYNPAFIITNIPRDIGLIWQSTEAYSKHVPIAAGQMVMDMGSVFKDVVNRKGRVLDYANEGGEMAFLTDYGRFKGQGYTAEKINSVTNLLGWAGKTSELMTRVMLRERGIKNGMAPYEATEMARNYLDFNQGGRTVKAIDKAIPYFNAGIQGTRSLFRAAKDNPKVFAYKAAQLGTISAGLYYANATVNPECWNQIPDRVKESNFIITTPFSYLDHKGQKRYVYFKIAKDQGQRIISTLFENAMAAYHEGKVSKNQIMLALDDLVNIDPTQVVPPAISATLGYMLNKDLWTKEDIWKGPENVAPEVQWNAYNSPLAKYAGDVGLSPAKTEYAVGRFLSSGNPFVGMVGGGAKLLTGQLSDELMSKSTIQLITENPTLKRAISSTNPYEMYREPNKELKVAEATRRFVQSRDIDDMVDKHLDAPTDESKQQILEYIRSQPPEDKERLVDRVKKVQQFHNIPDRTWWLSLTGMTPEVRAEAFWGKFKDASDDDKRQMIQTVRSVNGIRSDRFVARVKQLVAGSQK